MYVKGMKIRVTNDSILGGCMGIPTATGEIFCVSADGKRVIGFKCDQTGAIEGVDDGKIEVLS